MACAGVCLPEGEFLLTDGVPLSLRKECKMSKDLEVNENGAVAGYFKRNRCWIEPAIAAFMLSSSSVMTTEMGIVLPFSPSVPFVISGFMIVFSVLRTMSVDTFSARSFRVLCCGLGVVVVGMHLVQMLSS